jgi:hypothetical protein
MWYLDSTGGDFGSIQMLKVFREYVGPHHLTYTEGTTDMTLPYSDAYVEWGGSQTIWMSEQSRAELNYLFDNKVDWLVITRSSTPNPPPADMQPFYGDF